MTPPNTSLAVLLLSLWTVFSCSGPLKGPAGGPGVSDGRLALPTEWYCPWCSRGASPGPWEPSPPGAGQTAHRSPRHPGGLEFRVPTDYPLHWSEGIAPRRVGPGPMTADDARRLLERWAADGPGMEVGRVDDGNEVFEGTILHDGTPVGRVQVDKATGWFRQVE
jgi:hypothetical protein